MRSSTRPSGRVERSNSKMPAIPHMRFIGRYRLSLGRRRPVAAAKCFSGRKPISPRLLPLLEKLQQLLDAAVVSMLAADVIVCFLHHSAPIALVAKLSNRFTNVRQVMLHGNVVAIGLQNPVVVTFDQN